MKTAKNEMKNIVVVGAQWGDEGKGKIVDILAPYFDVVARYQGGHNAGHTVRVGGRTFVLHLVPSGILHDKCTCIIGNGVVVDPRAFNTEVSELRGMGIEVNNRLFVSNRAHLITPYHTAIERHREAALGGDSVGTTMRGIGPAYEDKASRTGLRAGDVLYPDFFVDKLRKNIEDANRYLAARGADGITQNDLIDSYISEAMRLEPFLLDTAPFIFRAAVEGRSVLLEGAQGTMLDVDHGTYPFVTSSSATSGGAATGTGLPPGFITGALGIAKAYTTRVGGGPFPTELMDETGAYLQKRGNEVGASTGRQRRTGWFDAVVVRYSTMLNGFDALAITKLDVLDDLDEIRICVAYRLGNERIEEMPYGANVLMRCEPIYETIQGWGSSTIGITQYDDLPSAARTYIDRIEQLCGASVAIISTGAERTETIVRRESSASSWMNPS